METTMDGIRQNSSNGMKLAGYFLLAAGIGFGIFGIKEFVKMSPNTPKQPVEISIFMGTIFIICGIAALKIATRRK